MSSRSKPGLLLVPKRPKAVPSTAIHPFDREHGTDTSGLLPGPQIAEGTGIASTELTAYYGVAPSILHGVIDRWLGECAPLQPIDRTVFLDVGAGKGRAMLLASQHPFLRVEGIELNPQLAALAEENIERWDGNARAEALAPLRLRLGDATRLPLPAEPTLAYLFHPFEAKLLRRFIRHVVKSLAAAPRPFDLVYVNAEHDSLLDREPCLQKLWFGSVPMSTADHLADLEAIAQQEEYGSTGDELCGIYRFNDQT